MKATARVLTITGILFFIACFLPSREITCLGGSFTLQNQALAATDSNQQLQPYSPMPHVPDPLEPFNRAMFTVNNDLYFWIMKPVAKGYATVVPHGVRKCIDNGFSNAMSPIDIVNSMLQGKFKITGIELARLLINSTMGVGGLFDVATTDFHLPNHHEDTGQTLGIYGMKPIMYLYWPVLGPSDLRDTIGTTADFFMIPYYYFTPGIASSLLISAGGIENKLSLHLGEYESFLKAAIDPYAATRDAYLQHRAEMIRR